MYIQWLFPTLILAGLQWYARWRNQRWLHMITKPAVILLLIGWLWQSTRFQGFSAWFGLALAFSLLGDILLMFPPGFFLAGLAAFLIGHISYCIGILGQSWEISLGIWFTGLFILIMMVAALRYYLPALKRKLVSKKIRSGVAAYILVIHFMLFSAFSTFWQLGWSAMSAVLVAAGALLFSFSDALLAYNRFITRVARAHFWIMMTYHMAQILIIAGVILRFLQPA